VTAEVLMEQIQAGKAPVILDVRSNWEFAQGHVPGAIHMPFWKVPAGAATFRVPPDRAIVIYCARGPRAYFAGAALRRSGFRNIAYLRGHMKNWREKKLPLEVS
jgi:rhodanese-related sulfurtransferase